MLRRDFLRIAGGGLYALGCAGVEGPARAVPGLPTVRAASSRSPDVVVIGAGVWGGFTALELRLRGANVTLVDAYGPGNARSSSGDETRGVRSSYGDRPGAQGELWVLWARESMRRWKALDAEWGRELRLDLFHTTGDLILRSEWDNFQLRTKVWWDKHGIPYQVLERDDVRQAFPVLAIDDIGAILYEPDAGVVRARRATQAVAAAFEAAGGRIAIGRASAARATDGRLEAVALDTGQTLRADAFVWCVGPWLGKTFPELFAGKMRQPIGYVCYFATPVGDHRFTYPNLPSYNFPGVTGWPALPVDNRGFRVRGSERAVVPAGAPAPPRPPQADVPPAQRDPDTSDRWADPARIEGSRRFIAKRFPLLASAPLAQTHACHYEATSSGSFIIDRHPTWSNAWIAAGGNAEGFKFAPVVGEYAARRVLGVETDPAVDALFRIPEKDFEPPAPAPAGAS
jgi:sarcosine oxidase